MEDLHDLVKRVVKAFEAESLSYAFTGALAASYYGVPRTTMDVDVIVEVSGKPSQGRLASALKQTGLHFDVQKIKAALKSGYNIVTLRDSKTPYSLDVILSKEKIKKRLGTIAGLSTFYQTPEDLVLAKLRMIKATVPRKRAWKDEEDIRAILAFVEVNVKVVRKQAGRDNTLSIFKTITADAYH